MMILMILQLLQLGTVTLNYISDLHTLSNILPGILLRPLFGFSLYIFFLRSSLINRSQGPKTHLPFSLPVRLLLCTTVSFRCSLLIHVLCLYCVLVLQILVLLLSRAHLNVSRLSLAYFILCRSHFHPQIP